ncbi:Alpha-tubulin suppressor [Stigmatella aurantiaca]|uniref:Alpha-tubulin suppressor n=1 Tax=Stigmatella aurantiaca TaxID=41 RepID=A0A1H7LAZ3_STIAU|nr:RCC1 repeat-containing protein [Stigmatella aurantiaca]SEK95966.1 Alpha-tubulin suppressor [Stigmatella aurantiaca]
MKTLRVLLPLGLLAGALGCADYGQEVAAFCDRNGESCDNTAPVITQSSQSATEVEARGLVTLSVTAQDKETPSLSFSWASTLGTLGEPKTTGSTSEITWTAPGCVPSGQRAEATVTVSNGVTETVSKTFTLSTEPCRILAVSAGGSHSLALRSDGTVWAWGSNNAGQLGNGRKDTVPVPVPGQVVGLEGVVAVAAGSSHSLALCEDGTVWAWGNGGAGQLGDGLALDSDKPVQVSAVTGVIALAAGDNHSMALRGDGTVWAWGSNEFGQLGDGTDNNQAIPEQVRGLPGDCTALAGGVDQSLAVCGGGNVWAWGYNDSGELGETVSEEQYTPVQVKGLTRIKAVASGEYHSLALGEDGRVWAWGDNSEKQLGDDDTENPRPTPSQVQGVTGGTEVAAGTAHSVVRTADGTIWTWGINGDGELGDGTDTSRARPAQVPGLMSSVSMDVGSSHTLVLTGNGIVWAWGVNGSGQLGNGTARQTFVPVHPLLP